MGPYERSELLAELAKVIQLIAAPDQRKSFTGDSRGTLEKAGVNLEVIPKEVVDTLAELSYDELALLSRIGESFARAGLVLEDLPDGGRVWFF
jgi:hypothetical protein